MYFEQVARVVTSSAPGQKKTPHAIGPRKEECTGSEVEETVEVGHAGFKAGVQLLAVDVFHMLWHCGARVYAQMLRAVFRGAGSRFESADAAHRSCRDRRRGFAHAVGGHGETVERCSGGHFLKIILPKEIKILVPETRVWMEQVYEVYDFQHRTFGDTYTGSDSRVWTWASSRARSYGVMFWGTSDDFTRQGTWVA
jgi:hypothetical protein